MEQQDRRDRDAPTPDAIKDLRKRARRTQAQAAQLLDVTERQIQRWESGSQLMPDSTWRMFRLTCGYRYPVDFTTTSEPTRGWDSGRDEGRDTIERGDTVYLRPVVGPMVEARVWLDGLANNETYGAYVIGFPGHLDAGQEFEGFFIGERVTFSVANVIHLEQRVPTARTSGS